MRRNLKLLLLGSKVVRTKTGMITFKIHPGLYRDDDKTFLTVKVFPTRKAMHRYQRRTDYWDERNRVQGFAGMCRTWTRTSYKRGKRPRVSHDIGDILISKTRNHYRSTEIVTHELTHAAIRYIKLRSVTRRMLASRLKWEEYLCYTVSDLIEQYFRMLKVVPVR